MSQTNQKESSHKSMLGWGIGMYAVAVFFYLYEFLLRVAPAPMYPQLERDFNIEHTELGMLSAAYYYSYALLQLPIGALTDKFGPRRLLTFAILLCAFSTILFAYTQSFWLATFARFLIGAGSAFAFISCLKIATVWFPAPWFPFVSGLTLAIGSLGAVCGSGPIAYLLDKIDWRQLMAIIGWVGIVVGFIAWLVIRDHNPQQPHLTRKKESAEGRLGFWHCLLHVMSQPQNWIIGAYAFLATAPTDAFGGMWGVPYLHEAHQIDTVMASLAASMTFLGMVFGSPLFGSVSEWMQSRKKPMYLGALLAGIILTVLIYSPSMTATASVLLFFFYGFFGTYILCFVAARDINSPIYMGTVVGFVNFLSMVGSALLTNGIGPLLDYVTATETYTAGDYHKALVVLPLFYAISLFIVLPILRESYKKEEPACK